MSKRTRLFVLGASAVVIVGLGTAGVASYVGFDHLLEEQASDELDYVPAGAEAVAFADVRRLMDSELGRKLHSQLPAEPAGVFAQAGVDIRTDVDYLVVASVPGQPTPNGMPLLLARGRFDPVKIEALAIEHGGQVTPYNGTRMVTTAQPPMGVAFLDHSLIAIGQPEILKLAVDSKAAGTSVKNDAELMRFAARVSDQQAWAVARFNALQHGPLPTGLIDQLPAVTWVAAGGQLDQGISATVHAEAKDDKAAQDLRDVIRGLVAVVRIQAGSHPEYAELVNSIQLTGEGTAVSIGFSIPPQLLEKLGAFGARTRAAASGAAAGGRRPLSPRIVARRAPAI
jgi:hypothetical protein